MSVNDDLNGKEIKNVAESLLKLGFNDFDNRAIMNITLAAEHGDMVLMKAVRKRDGKSVPVIGLMRKNEHGIPTHIHLFAEVFTQNPVIEDLESVQDAAIVYDIAKNGMTIILGGKDAEAIAQTIETTDDPKKAPAANRRKPAIVK